MSKRRKKLSSAQIEEARAFYKESGSYQKTAIRMGVGYSTIRYVLIPGEREARNAQNKVWKEKNPERVKEFSRLYHLRHPERTRGVERRKLQATIDQYFPNTDINKIMKKRAQ